ncbi:hypothetical protein [Bradyrhizobium sp. MOS002]|uniref:hypothetical protein n=1 Tax=Bradyrhizobium sp. MOS002 TaxID=2133947 RepID=UPI000D12471E|nr:hypothetical protein [Bradyrhizobium sp. MOS002]PSO25116.1 hypothetical protein C7G41_29815 [Bradyrhizobium sp. MOS002]
MRARKSKQHASLKRPSLRLDDPRWISLALAHHIRSEQLTGERYADLATPQIVEALVSEKLHSMRRNMATGECEGLSGPFWRGRDIIIIDHQFQITPRGPRPGVHWETFVWKPDVDRLWPAAQTEQEAQTEKNVWTRREPPGPAPTRDWKMLVAREVIRRLMVGLKFPRAPEMRKFCKSTVGYEPDDSDIRKHLKILRGQ